MRKRVCNCAMTAFLLLHPGFIYSQSDTSRLREQIVETAKKYIGTRYRFGGNSSRGFDCSGFVRHVFAKFDIRLPHSSAGQYHQARHIKKDEALPGDLVFFTTYRPGPSHVGIYIGNDRFIHSPRPGKRIQIVDMNRDYWRRRYIGFGTFIQ